MRERQRRLRHEDGLVFDRADDPHDGKRRNRDRSDDGSLTYGDPLLERNHTEFCRMGIGPNFRGKNRRLFFPLNRRDSRTVSVLSRPQARQRVPAPSALSMIEGNPKADFLQSYKPNSHSAKVQFTAGFPALQTGIRHSIHRQSSRRHSPESREYHRHYRNRPVPGKDSCRAPMKKESVRCFGQAPGSSRGRCTTGSVICRRAP